MHPVLMFIASGWGFWCGLAVLAVAIPAGLRGRSGATLSLTVTATVLGILLVALSSTPVSGWIIWPLFAAALAMVVTLRFETPWRYGAAALTAALAVSAAVLELPYWLDPEPLVCREKLWILADSISSGIGFEEETVWSELLEREHPGRIANRAVPGSKVSSSLRILEERFDFSPGDVLLIELGGNDLLGGVSGDEFARKLDELLSAVAAREVPAVMFELPLPPFRGAYLRAQRFLAEKYGVRLIPRRRFAAVLRGSESVVDGVHLSNYGHEKMAEVVRGVVRFDEPHRAAPEQKGD